MLAIIGRHFSVFTGRHKQKVCKKCVQDDNEYTTKIFRIHLVHLLRICVKYTYLHTYVSLRAIGEKVDANSQYYVCVHP